jgi:hypothetical protein
MYIILHHFVVEICVMIPMTRIIISETNTLHIIIASNSLTVCIFYTDINSASQEQTQ